MKKQLLLLVMILLPLVASADVVEIDGIYYNLIPKGNAAEVTSNPNKYTGNVVIPASVSYDGIEYSVTSIGQSAFSDCSGLTSVTIPNSVTILKRGAFYGCSGLTAVTIPNSVIEIEDGYQNASIIYGVFQKCSSLTSVIIGNGVTSIGNYAFYECTGLASVTLPSSVTSIHNRAFSRCSGLTSFTIPNSVTSIEEYAFSGCSSLTSVTIPNSVTSLETGTFEYCGLTSVTIPNSIKYIKGGYVYSGNCSGAFYGCQSLKSVIIGNSVISIGDYSFCGCNNLTEITIPNCVTSIGERAFEDCSNLTSVTIGSGVTSMGTRAFYGCSGLTTVRISDLAAWCNISFYIYSNPLYYAHHLYFGEEEIKDLVIPNSVTSISGGAFSDCSGLTSVTMGNSVTSIGGQAFENCSGLNSVMIGNSVTSIEYEAFRNCSGLTSITIPNSVTIIRSGAFEKCSSLTSLTIGSGVKSIYYHAFASCKELADVYCLAETLPTLNNDGHIEDADIFLDSYIEYATLHVPAGSIDAYSAAEPWKNFKSIVKIEMPKYKLTYMVDNAEYKIYEVEYGAAITPEPEPIKEGYTFSGWSEIPETMPDYDVTITGSFTINKYKLNYMVDDAEYKSYEVEFGATVTPEPAPTKEGYTFSGWSEIPETMPAYDVTVTGSFTINKYKLTYMVDDAEYKSYEVEYGAAITPEPEPTKEGYTFSGWSEIPETMPAHDVTVMGSFTKGAYKLTYMVDGEVYKTISYDYGATITPEPAPTKEGYTFSGWSEIPETMPAHDVIVTGTFAINKYKLTYVVDGEEYKSYELEYGTSITPEPTPTKEGYSFSGWSDIPETMPAHDVTVTGTFTVNQYIITYIIDNEVYMTQTVDYGSIIVPPTAPEREGYDFAWGDYPETMPAYDITIYGTYTTGIEAIIASEVNCQIFSLDGKLLNELQKGVNIVRMSNGQVRKVVVK